MKIALRPVLLLVLLALVISVVYLIKYKSWYEFHRSRMYEYKILASLLTVYPPGTDQQRFLSDLGIDSTHLSADTMGAYAVFRPFLDIPQKLYRDYYGFRVDFRENRVVAISPIGPQPYPNIVEVDIKEILHQRMNELSNARKGTQQVGAPDRQ